MVEDVFAPACEHKYFSSVGMIENTHKTTKYSLFFRTVHSLIYSEADMCKYLSRLCIFSYKHETWQGYRT